MSLTNGHSIVAIHGLDTCSERTWTAYEKDGDKNSRLVHWLRDADMLPFYFGDARICTYDWNASTFSDASGQCLYNHADTFLSTLEAHRKVSNVPPSMFPGAYLCYFTSSFEGITLSYLLHHVTGV